MPYKTTNQILGELIPKKQLGKIKGDHRMMLTMMANDHSILIHTKPSFRDTGFALVMGVNLFLGIFFGFFAEGHPVWIGVITSVLLTVGFLVLMFLGRQAIKDSEEEIKDYANEVTKE